MWKCTHCFGKICVIQWLCQAKQMFFFVSDEKRKNRCAVSKLVLCIVVLQQKMCLLSSLPYKLCFQKLASYYHLLLVDSTHTVCNIYCICQVFKRPLGVLINVS